MLRAALCAALLALSAPRVAAAADEAASSALGGVVELSVTLAEDQRDTLEQVAVSTTRRVDFKSLEHTIVIEGSTRSDKRLRSALKGLRNTVSAFEHDGGRIAICIHCLDSGVSLAYNTDELLYPASSIKGPYVISLYESLDEGLIQADRDHLLSLAAPTIIESDNDTYDQLRETFGARVFADWCATHGIVSESGTDYDRLDSTYHYPMLTCGELAGMWMAGQEYLAGQSDGARELEQLFVDRTVSPLREGVSSKAQTIAKAGWYPTDNGPKSCATVDAGIVSQGSHRYVVAIMTNAPADLDLLASMVPGIWTARKALW